MNHYYSGLGVYCNLMRHGLWNWMVQILLKDLNEMNELVLAYFLVDCDPPYITQRVWHDL